METDGCVTLKSVFRVPRAAVSYERTLYTVRSNRLTTVSVAVDYVDDDYTYVSKGVSQGDCIITTRLVDPLERALLDVVAATKEDDS